MIFGIGIKAKIEEDYPMCALINNNLGYPRIGENREWKKALEAFWAGKLDESQFTKQN